MNRFLFSLTIMLSVALSSQAQDKLIKRNGSFINGKVTEVGVREIRYQTSSDPNSAKFVIRKGELDRIEFGNGETFIIDERAINRKKEPSKHSSDLDYGRNIISVSPFKALDSGAGLGLSYERLIGENQYVGLVLPVTFIFREDYRYNGSGSSSDYFTNVYVSPGLKIYPFGQRKVTYAVGPNVMLGFLKKNDSQYVPSPNGGGYYYNAKVNNFRLGLLINNYLNFQITSRINLGLNGGLGMRYLDRTRTSSIGIYGNGLDVTGEFAFNFGFRF